MFVEDDVVPPLDAIDRLRAELFPTDCAGVSGAVHSRYADRWIAHYITQTNPLAMEPAVTPDSSEHAIQPIHCVGFGCLLIRSAALRDIVFRPHPEPGSHYSGSDFAMCRDLHRLGWNFKIRWDVRCRHYGKDGSYV